MRRPQNLEKSPTCFDIYSVNVKTSGRSFQIFVAFSEKLNFTTFRFDFHVGWKNQNKHSTLNSSFDTLLKWHEPDINHSQWTWLTSPTTKVVIVWAWIIDAPIIWILICIFWDHILSIPIECQAIKFICFVIDVTSA